MAPSSSDGSYDHPLLGGLWPPASDSAIRDAALTSTSTRGIDPAPLKRSFTPCLDKEQDGIAQTMKRHRDGLANVDATLWVRHSYPTWGHAEEDAQTIMNDTEKALRASMDHLAASVRGYAQAERAVSQIDHIVALLLAGMAEGAISGSVDPLWSHTQYVAWAHYVLEKTFPEVRKEDVAAVKAQLTLEQLHNDER